MFAVSTKQAEARRAAAAPLAGPAPGPLSMYAAPPVEEVTLEDFEGFAIDRLRVLKAIEEAQSRGKKPEEIKSLIATKLHETRLNASEGDEWSRRDVVSHFVLRLAYCRSEDLRRWYTQQECALFRHRFCELGPSAKAAFLTTHGLPYSPLTPAEFDSPDAAGVPVRAHLRTVLEQTHGVRKDAAAALVAEGAASFYAVPFADVPELVRGRRAYLRGGRAYVHRDGLASLVVGLFRARLARALAHTSRAWAARFAADEADRVGPIVEALATRYLGADYGGGGAAGGADGGAGATLAELDALAAQSFPLCMRNLYGHLKDAHHLRHGGRMQLGLFLKGIGLPCDQALAFWKQEFCKRMPPDGFDKQYAYGIRHNYGREGKRADYTPYSCMKIIMSAPGTGDHHGCPFRSFGEEGLRAALRALRVAGPAASEVLDKARGQHYQLACGAAFAAAHGGCEIDEGVQHPNQYYSASRKALAAAAAAAAAAGLPATPPAARGGGGAPLPASAGGGPGGGAGVTPPSVPPRG